MDIGCGDGSFTTMLSDDFNEVHGIDVQDNYLSAFRDLVRDCPRYIINNMSASEMTFPDGYFDKIVSIETLEHVPDLENAAHHIARVLATGGEFILTVPNRWFPFENHGIQIGQWKKAGRIPLLPYIPWLHKRFAQARVFTVRQLDRLFIPNGLKRVAVDYAWPTFEHGGNALQPFIKHFFRLMRVLEESPVRLFGSSVIVKYIREPRFNESEEMRS